MGLLNKVALNQQINKMTASNLAIVFAPTLYRPRNETIEVVIGDSGQANLLIETFIKEYESLFLKKKEEPSKESSKHEHSKEIQNFNVTIRRGTLKMAQSFIEDEKKAPVESTDEELPENAEKLLYESISKSAARRTTTTTAVWTLFNQDGTEKKNDTSLVSPAVLPKSEWKVSASRPRSTSSPTDGVATGKHRPPIDRTKKYNAPPLEIIDDEGQLSPEIDDLNDTSSYDSMESTDYVESTDFAELNASPSSEEKPKITMSIQELVDELLGGQVVVVERYLDTLEVSDRKKIVDEMNASITQRLVSLT